MLAGSDLTRQKVSAVCPEPIISRPLLLAKVGKAASDADQTALYLNPPHGRAAMPRKLLDSFDAALQHLKAAA